MYICLCRGVNQKMIEALRAEGKTPEQAMAELGVGQDCGSCLDRASELAKDTRG